MSPRRAVWVCIPLLCLACGKRSSDPGAGPTQVTAVAASGPGAIRLPVKVDEKGFTPSSVAIKQGIPASVVFTRTSDDTCATQVVFPELNITKDLPLNTAVSVDVPTDTPRTMTFQCGMGMYKSSIIVR